MYGYGFPTPPLGVPATKYVVRSHPDAVFPGPLTREALLEALYCCSPTGKQQLTQHLHERGATFKAGELDVLLRALAAEELIYEKPHPLPGAGAIMLFSRPGYGL